MRILKVIHGYPPVYNAGSEVYSQNLCHALSNKHTVAVFTREDNPFLKDGHLRLTNDSLLPNIPVYIVNACHERLKHRYQVRPIDQAFIEVLDQFKPDVIHIGHLNHLSIDIVSIAYQRGLPIVYTLHDYWLMCPRGQFIQRSLDSTKPLWPLCDGQEDKKCAISCYAGYYSGSETTYEMDVDYWTSWVKHRMDTVKEAVKKIDYFIAPSKFLQRKFIREFTVLERKIGFQDYGFNLTHFPKRKRQTVNQFTFGYIGTHIPTKGIQFMIEAIKYLEGDFRVSIWGRVRESTSALKQMIDSLSIQQQARIQWCGEYINKDIVDNVMNHVDCIIVPSIWYENSPLVIHEALQSGVPVITADCGGMAEYIQHHVNGLLFKHRDPKSLATSMQYFIDHPHAAQTYGKKRYLQSETGDIPDILKQAEFLIQLYSKLMADKKINDWKKGDTHAKRSLANNI